MEEISGGDDRVVSVAHEFEVAVDDSSEWCREADVSGNPSGEN